MIETMGGKRIVRLRVIGGSIELRDDVPATRADCPTERPCPHVRCRHHLWMIDGRDRRGRRGPGRALPASELRPIWMEWPLPPSCGADLYGTEYDPAAVAEILDMSLDAIAGCARRARQRLIALIRTEPEAADALRELLGAAP